MKLRSRFSFFNVYVSKATFIRFYFKVVLFVLTFGENRLPHFAQFEQFLLIVSQGTFLQSSLKTRLMFLDKKIVICVCYIETEGRSVPSSDGHVFNESK